MKVHYEYYGLPLCRTGNLRINWHSLLTSKDSFQIDCRNCIYHIEYFHIEPEIHNEDFIDEEVIDCIEYMGQLDAGKV